MTAIWSAAEVLRYLRREHARIEYPVACCRQCHQNWPCDVIRGISAAVCAERERNAALVDDLADHAVPGVARVALRKAAAAIRGQERTDEQEAGHA